MIRAYVNLSNQREAILCKQNGPLNVHPQIDSHFKSSKLLQCSHLYTHNPGSSKDGEIQWDQLRTLHQILQKTCYK